MKGVSFHPEAAEEYANAASYYLAEAGLRVAERFVVEVEGLIRRSQRWPEWSAKHVAGTRRAVLRRFPYALVYLDHPDRIRIVAVMHCKRRPGYWLPRAK